MKKRFLRRVSGSGGAFIGMPTLLIAAGWLGLWFLWPSGALPARIGPKRLAKTDVKFIQIDYSKDRMYTDPTAMLLPFRYGFGDNLAQSRPAPEPVGLRRITESLYLENSGEHRSSISNSAWVIKPENTQFDCGYDTPDVFEKDVVPDMRLNIRVSPGLKERGFTLPPDQFTETEGDEAWSVEATVEIDSAGRVEHVFLDRASTAGDLGARLIRILGKAYVKEPGPEITGRVIVNYGLR
ncbi:MAG: hypothetical protein ACOC6C_05095 [Verrucomicrobiota bacterium]